MKQKLTILGLSGLLLLTGCRADDMVTNAKRQDNWAKKFKTFFKSSPQQEVNYAEGFRQLALKYDSLHQTNISGRQTIDKLLKSASESKLNIGDLASTPYTYIDFNVRSQLIVQENGNKWILFPKVSNKQVTDLMVAVLTEDETRFGIYTLDSHSQIYADNIDAFRKAYNKHKYHLSVSAKDQLFLSPMKICGQDNACNIDEVIITIPPVSQEPYPPMGFFPPSYGGGFPECDGYRECIPPFYGGPMPMPDPIYIPPTDPCEKAKTGVNNANEIAKNTKFTSAKNGIMAAFNNNGKENGVAFGKNSPNGTLNATGVQNYQQNSGTVSNPYAYPVADMHNHPNSNPPSAGDVYSMMQHHLEHGSFSTRYVITSDGSMYALIITDTEAIRKFLQDYPPSQIPGHNPNFPLALLNELNNLELNMNSESGALAHILTKYNAGVSLSKADSNGRFRNINIQETQNPDGSLSHNYTLCP
ncbi:hypothetical protein PG630_02635 [Riemerella anatipestifer]|nr:hypothetical protein [Riemerella anatipestifer]